MKASQIKRRDESVANTMLRIAAAVEAGAKPRLTTAFERDLHRVFGMAFRLGNGDLDAGLSQLMQRDIQVRARRREQDRLQYPVDAMVREMLESENPLNRAVVRALAGLAHLPTAEFRRLSNKLLADEVARSTAILPTLSGPIVALPAIEDPTDQRIWKWIQDNPNLTDAALGARLNISRQAVNARRRSLAKMGYPVRRLSRQKP